MGKGNKVGWGGTAKGTVGMVDWWCANVKLPQFGGRSVLTLENDCVVMTDGHISGSEVDITTGITKLTNG